MKYSALLIGISSIVLTACNRPVAKPLTPIPPIVSPTPTPSISLQPTPIASPSPTTSISTQPKPTISPSPTPTSIQPTPTVAPAPNAGLIPSIPTLPTLTPTSKPLQAGEYQVIDELKKPQFVARSQEIFKPTQLPTVKVNFNPSDLLVVLNNTRQYFQDRWNSDPDLQREGILATQGIKVSEVTKTLDFMVLTLQQDMQAKRPIRLQDPKFINKHFRTIQWTAFNPVNQDEKRLRLTKYAVFTHPGSRKPTQEFNVGIYALKPNSNTEELRLKYTKQDVLKNIYEPNGKEFGTVEPLAYLDREGLESALMEGTILVKFTDGTSEFFNVDRNNGIPFVKGLTPTEQQRYWYFKPVTAIKGYGDSIETKISIKPGVTFAGDVLNIGLGKIIAIEHSRGGKPQLQMGIIADTGGAFLPNLHQLDFLAGVFNSKDEFTAYTRKLPEYTKAYILVKR